jgi:hypothetical protein
MQRTVAELVAAASDASRTNPDTAYEMIVDFVLKVTYFDNSIGRVFSSPELDQICLSLGASAGKTLGPVDEKKTLFLVTAISTSEQLYILRRLIDSIPGDCMMLVSNIRHSQTQKSVREALLLPKVVVEISPHVSLSETALWMQDRLREYRPKRVFIFPDHFDATIIAAVQPALTNQLFYFHSCNTALALGLHVPHAVHIDFSAKRYNHCRNRLGIKSVLLPVLVDPSQSSPPSESSQRSGVLTCTTSPEIYEVPRRGEPFSYSLSFPDVIACRLEVASGQHVHVGALSSKTLSEIERRLSSSGNPLRFKHLPSVPSIASFVIEAGVDLYMGSLPGGSTFALMQVMSAGIPMVLHHSHRHHLFSDLEDAYPGALHWTTLCELKSLLRSITGELLAAQRCICTDWYQRNFTSDNYLSALRNVLDGSSETTESDVPNAQNALQSYLDERRGREQYVAMEVESEGASTAVDLLATQNTPFVNELQNTRTIDILRLVVSRISTRIRSEFGI